MKRKGKNKRMEFTYLFSLFEKGKKRKHKQGAAPARPLGEALEIILQLFSNRTSLSRQKEE